MQLTPANAELLRSLAQGLGCEHRRFPAGSVLQTRFSSPEVLLVLAGHCRLLDPDRQFGSLTVLRAEAPYLCGALKLLNPSLNEELIASTDCEALVLGSMPLHGELEEAVLSLLREELSASEIPLIQRFVQGYGINLPADQQTPRSICAAGNCCRQAIHHPTTATRVRSSTPIAQAKAFITASW